MSTGKEFIKTRYYPLNVPTKTIYLGRHKDGRYGFPREKDLAWEWRGVGVGVIGIKGDHAEKLIKRGVYKVQQRSIYKER